MLPLHWAASGSEGVSTTPSKRSQRAGIQTVRLSASE